MDSQKTIDCQKVCGEPCSVTITGTEEEIVPLMVHHLTTMHSRENNPDLEKEIRDALEDKTM